MLRSSLFRRCAAVATASPSASSSASSPPTETRISLTTEGLRAHKAFLTAQLTERTALLKELTHTKEAIDLAAHSRAVTYAYAGAVYIGTQTSILFAWTYHVFDWNLVEPITYLLGYGVVWLTVLLYFTTGRDFAYAEVRSMLLERSQRKLYAAKGFDVVAYARVEAEVSELTRAVEGLSKVQ